MSMAYLGESFDLHTGGVDNIFPHHEDERAQSEAATGKPFVRLWMHCAHLMVDGRKMSKSEGNFFTLRDLLGKGYSGREIRYVLLSAHYRIPLNFMLGSLDAARAALGRVDAFTEALDRRAGSVSEGRVPDWADARLREFEAAMSDDLNVSAALAALFELAHEGNRGSILVAASLAVLIAAMVIEDRQLQREALQRDVDSTAQQLSARLLLVR